MISVDKVYRKLQDLANKDQRSSINPALFNNFAEMVIFAVIENSRKIIYDSRVLLIKGTGDLDRVEYAKDVIDYFYTQTPLVREIDGYPRPDDIDSLDDLYYRDTRIEKAPNLKHVYLLQRMGRHLNPSENTDNGGDAVYIENTKGYAVFPNSIEDTISAYYWRKPFMPKWTYTVVNNTPIFNASASDRQDFELPDRYLDEVVYRMALLAGINIRDKALLDPLAGIIKKDETENN